MRHLKLFISNQFVFKSFVYYVRHLGRELNRLRFSVVVWSDRTLSRAAFWRGVRSDRKIMTGNIFMVMRQNYFGHDQDHDFIRVFKYCYLSVDKYSKRVHLLMQVMV